MDIDLSSVSSEVRAVITAIDAVCSVALAEVPGPEALEDCRALLAVKEQLDAHLLHRVRDVEVRQLHELDAMPTVGTWVQSQTTSLDRRQITLARRLDRLPAIRRELAAGRLSMLGAQRVAAAVERVRGCLDRPDGMIDGQPADLVLDAVILRGVPILVGEALGGLADDDLRLRMLLAELVEVAGNGAPEVERVEAAFVALACRVEARCLPSSLDQLVDALLPAQLEDRSAQAHHRRALALERERDGSGWRLEADLDDETGELLHASLAAALAADPENVADTAAAAERRAAGGEPHDATGLRLPRPVWMRRHDAFRAILRDWLDSGLAGTRGKAVPQILVRVGLDTLHAEPGALPPIGGSGRTVPVSLVRRWMCDSAVTRFVMGIGNKVIELSHTARTLKAHERRAKLMETGGRCQAAGCHPLPGTPLVPHHPEAFARKARTSFADTVMLCESSHHDLHEGGKTLRLKDGRLLGPDGWVPQILAA